MSDILMSYQRFAQSVKIGNPDHIYLRAIQVFHGREKHTLADWNTLLKALKNRPVKARSR